MASSTSYRSVILAPVDDTSIPKHLVEIINDAVRLTLDRLTIILVSDLFDLGNSSVSRTQTWSEVQTMLTFVYIQASKAAQALDKILLEIDVLLKGVEGTLPSDLADSVDVLYEVHATDTGPVHARLAPLNRIRQVISIAINQDSHAQRSSADSPEGPSSYPVIVLGGTFDHLHSGHKVFLSMAAWIASEKVIVGVTHDKLLVNKKHKEVLEDLETRKSKVASFLSRFRPDLVYYIVPIEDVYGPTGTDPNIQALVLTQEPSTISGADMIDAFRAEKGFPKLQRYTIDVIPITESNLEAVGDSEGEDAEAAKEKLKKKMEEKMSSTFIRGWIVKNQMQNK